LAVTGTAAFLAGLLTAPLAVCRTGLHSEF
jgi:hypothetical protein